MAELREQIASLIRRHQERSGEVAEKFLSLEGRVKWLEVTVKENARKEALVKTLLYD